jgi:hypothetical protein
MKAEIAADPRRTTSSTAGVVASILGWFAELGQIAKFFLRPRHGSPENLAEGAVAEAEATHAATDSPEAKPTAAQSCATTLSVEVNIGPTDILSQAVPNAQEIERRRALVRTLFNDFWSGEHDKPAAFVDRLDQAEDCLNQRLAAHGEFWRLDPNTRNMLGLPPRSTSPH